MDNEDLNIPEKTPDTPISSKRIKLNAVDKHFADILNKSIMMREKRELEKNNEDEDKLFCLSLYKELKKVPEAGKIRTKIQLLETIQRAQDFYTINDLPGGSSYQPQQQHYQHPPLYNTPQYGQGNAGGCTRQAAQARNLPATSPTPSYTTSDHSSDLTDLY